MQLPHSATVFQHTHPVSSRRCILPLSRRIYTKNRMHIMLACDDTTTKSDKKHTELIGIILVRMGMSATDCRLGHCLVNINDRNNHPVYLTQIVCSHTLNPVITSAKRPRGRPLGSHNKPLQDQPRSPEVAQIDTQITQILHENNGGIPLRYIAFDGNFGNILTLEMVQSVWRKNRYPQ